MSYWEFPPYVSVAEKRARATAKCEKLKKKNPSINPIIIEGRAIARTWWGKAWNANLESYADFSNRIGRGRSYVRHRAVLDLQISPGEVHSLVQGSESRPYSVTITIKAINKKIWKDIKTACSGKMESLGELLEGKFPKELGKIFTAHGQGLFPAPEEIDFNCSCPDWTYMCKHVAATLYGVGARLDEDPSLFFTLRKAKQADLITQAVKEKTGKLLKKAERKTRRVIADSDLADVFGIAIDDGEDIDLKQGIAKKKKKTRKKVSGASLKKTRKKTAVKVVKKTAGKHSKKVAKPAKTDADLILGIIKRSRKGVDFPALKKRTNIDEKKIRSIIYRAYNKGVITRISRGVYKGA